MADIESAQPGSFRESFPRPIERAQLLTKMAAAAVGTIVTHPLFIFQTPAEVFGAISEEKLQKREQHREVVGDRLFVKIANFQLSRELGAETHRMYLCDHLADLRYEYGLPRELPVQSMEAAMAHSSSAQ